jgi:hypothetical protein
VGKVFGLTEDTTAALAGGRVGKLGRAGLKEIRKSRKRASIPPMR